MNELEKRAKFHKKRLKGLPLSYLNTDAGNVEHTIEMFNKMSSPIDGPSNNPISGPFGGDVLTSTSSGEGMGESLEQFNVDPMIEIEYDDLVITVFGDRRDIDDWDEWQETISWTYKVDKNDIELYIFDECLNEEDFPDYETAEDEEIDQFILDHFDELFNKYYSKIKEHFRESAEEDAQDRYEYEPPYPDIEENYNLWEDLHKPITRNSVREDGNVDDHFDMFLRGF